MDSLQMHTSGRRQNKVMLTPQQEMVLFSRCMLLHSLGEKGPFLKIHFNKANASQTGKL